MEESANLHEVLPCCLLFSHLSAASIVWSQSGSIPTATQDVLKGVTFSVEPRMKVAVVGILLARCDKRARGKQDRLLRVHHWTICQANSHMCIVQSSLPFSVISSPLDGLSCCFSGTAT